MAGRDFYKTLGLSIDADQISIKSAYRKLAMQYHPDKNPGDKSAEEKFKEINQAYEGLKDPKKRSMYDRYGETAFSNSSSQQDRGFNFSEGFSSIFEEMFGDFMHGEQAQRQERRGEDLRYDLSLTLEDIYTGVEKEISFEKYVHCEVCHAKGGDGKETCFQCHGRGKVRHQQGFFIMEQTCVSCSGTGEIVKNACKACSGSGRSVQNKKLKVNIPAGVESGNRIRIPGEGNAGTHAGESGDLYIFLTIKAHEIFQTKEANLFCRVPIPMVVAALGGSIQIPSMKGGVIDVSIPAGTQHGDIIKVKKSGMPVYRRNTFGDLEIQILVEIPKHLNTRQKDVLKKFDESLSPAKNQPESTGFWERLKTFILNHTPLDKMHESVKRDKKSSSFSRYVHRGSE